MVKRTIFSLCQVLPSLVRRVPSGESLWTNLDEIVWHCQDRILTAIKGLGTMGHSTQWENFVNTDLNRVITLDHPRDHGPAPVVGWDYGRRERGDEVQVF